MRTSLVLLVVLFGLAADKIVVQRRGRRGSAEAVTGRPGTV
jgi:hypothetical protein